METHLKLKFKEQNAMFLVVFRSDVGFDHPFFACPIGGASKISHAKSRVLRKKFVHAWYYTSF